MALKGAVQTGTDTAGGTVRPLQTKFRIRGAPIAVLGSPVDGHGPAPHASPSMAEGLSRFRIIQGGASYLACIEGHAATCGHTATGRPWFRIEEDK